MLEYCGMDGRTPLTHAVRTDNIDFPYIILLKNIDLRSYSTDNGDVMSTIHWPQHA
jgi:hypothetical protein